MNFLLLVQSNATGISENDVVLVTCSVPLILATLSPQWAFKYKEIEIDVLFVRSGK